MSSPVRDPAICQWCPSPRGEVMITKAAGETATGVWLCPVCDYAEKYKAGPPVAPGNIRDAEPTP